MNELLATAAALPKCPGHDALRMLGGQVRACAATVDAADLDAVRAGDPRRILARHPDGPVVALRWYEPGYTSTVHSHDWTVLLTLDGGGTLERFALFDGRAKAVAAEPNEPQSLTVIDGGEIHRQHAGAHGALEFIVIGDYDAARPHTEYDT